MNSITWKNLATIGNNLVVKRTYLYLFLIPVAASITDKLSKLGIFSEIPISWKLLFLSAICFSLGSLIFQICAPLIIKENNNYSDFESNGRTWSHIDTYTSDLKLPFDEFNQEYREFRKAHPVDFAHEAYMSAFIETLDPKQIKENQFIGKYYNDMIDMRPTWSSSFSTESEEAKVQRELHNDLINERSRKENLKTCFWNLFVYCQYENTACRITCSIFFLGGIVTFIIVTFRSIIEVFFN